ncbi:hypothetical protein [Flavobacterium muglaense]|uniref:Lipoprotein n=1 Tax=Flavobacterium muglaense TaxID=2764716 RepID=A0A923N3Y8_9FLAO|nr:hypothetical protein [Flavobacterium muglaense]MBC5839588.1 hypothetical protein [Flavobacterium muglaense]MBC5846124.1 hypothetical protein [Flavobacterium muglaense]
MKKLFVLLVAVVFVSCSKDSLEPINASAEASLSVLDGKMLSFKDDKSFIKEYSQLSELKSTKEIQSWISKKGHLSRLNTENVSAVYLNDEIDNSEVIYSDALNAILNTDSKFKINETVIWLNERVFYKVNEKDIDKTASELLLIKNKLEVYGSLLNVSSKSSNSTNKTVPNENRSKDWVQYFDNSNRRLVLVLSNETIKYSNGEIASSKMFLYTAEQYKSCSFWRCTWKTNTSTINKLTFAVSFDVASGWTSNQGSGVFDFANGSNILLATNYIPTMNFNGFYNINTSVLYNSSMYNWSQIVQWY